MTFPSTLGFQGRAANHLANGSLLPRNVRRGIFNSASSYSGSIVGGLPVKVSSIGANGTIIYDVSAQTDSAAQGYIMPNPSREKLPLNGVEVAPFAKGDAIEVFETLGEDEYTMLYTVASGQSVTAGNKATYVVASNTVKEAGSTDIPIGYFAESGAAGDIVRVNMKNFAGIGLKEPITTLS
jgi:hypothetical protein